MKVKRSDQKSGAPFCACQKGIIIIKSNTSRKKERKEHEDEREREKKPQITRLSPF